MPTDTEVQDYIINDLGGSIGDAEQFRTRYGYEKAYGALVNWRAAAAKFVKPNEREHTGTGRAVLICDLCWRQHSQCNCPNAADSEDGFVLLNQCRGWHTIVVDAHASDQDIAHAAHAHQRRWMQKYGDGHQERTTPWFQWLASGVTSG